MTKTSSVRRSGITGKQAIDWIQKFCRIPEGRDQGTAPRLRPWQKREIRKIYDNKAGTRRAIISFGRKNAKSTLAAFLLLLHLCGPAHKRNSQLYSTAQSREQAAVLFNLAAKIVRMSPALRATITVRDTAKELLCPELGTRYRALSAEVATAYGLNPAFCVHDELGQVRGPASALYDAIETATGAADRPLSIIISTQAATDNDLLSILIDDALAGHDPQTVVSLYTAPQELPAFVESTIKLANPAFGDFLDRDEVMAMASAAERMPSRESEFRNLILNQRVEASSPFVSRETWARCNAPAKALEGVPVYGGLDLSETQDLTALVLIGRVGDVWQVHPTFWLPGDTIHDRTRIDRQPYDVWQRQGFITAAPGKSVDYSYVAEYLWQVFGRLNIRKIAFDRWNFRHLKPALEAAGFTEALLSDRFMEFGQGFQSMSPALRDLETEILNGRLAHGGNPVLTMCAANAVVQMDPAGNRKLAKNRSPGRIDGMVALTMALGAVPQEVERKPEYQMIFV